MNGFKVLSTEKNKQLLELSNKHSLGAYKDLHYMIKKNRWLLSKKHSLGAYKDLCHMIKKYNKDLSIERFARNPKADNNIESQILQNDCMKEKDEKALEQQIKNAGTWGNFVSNKNHNQFIEEERQQALNQGFNPTV